MIVIILCVFYLSLALLLNVSSCCMTLPYLKECIKYISWRKDAKSGKKEEVGTDLFPVSWDATALYLYSVSLKSSLRSVFHDSYAWQTWCSCKSDRVYRGLTVLHEGNNFCKSDQNWLKYDRVQISSVISINLGNFWWRAKKSVSFACHVYTCIHMNDTCIRVPTTDSLAFQARLIVY